MRIAIFSEKLDLFPPLFQKVNVFKEKNNIEIYCVTFRYYFSDLAIENLRNYKFDKLIILTNLLLLQYDPESFSLALYEFYKRYKPDLIILGDTLKAREIASKISSKLDIPCFLNCLDFKISENRIVVKKLTYGGIFISSYEGEIPAVITLNVENSEEISEIKSSTKVNTEEIEISVNVSRVLVRDIIKLNHRIPEIKKAKNLIVIGEEFQKKEELKLIEELSNLINGVISCTRLISTKNKWFNEWIGISGIKVNPNLYIGIGVSGSPQHQAGMINSKIIISLTSNIDAPILKICDYAFIGDIYKILKILNKKLKKKIKKIK